ncbi:hypothetical protein LPTSP2_23490 [Leptospira ellinghausenii]|uniref:Uncharacterized protein n=1 Tax=Leptospira ellinghausenii TaxID=1917822 RepID=A0A2P2DEJ0_9LEPT|nr:hypothetical protein LPTSP2_23490 [Leptospira ellinghausenii]
MIVCNQLRSGLEKRVLVKYAAKKRATQIRLPKIKIKPSANPAGGQTGVLYPSIEDKYKLSFPEAK